MFCFLQELTSVSQAMVSTFIILFQNWIDLTLILFSILS